MPKSKRCENCGSPSLVCVNCGHIRRPAREMSKAREEAVITLLLSGGALPPALLDEPAPECPGGALEATEGNGATEGPP